MSPDNSPSSKRRKVAEVDPEDVRQRRSAFLSTLSRAVTPPAKNAATSQQPSDHDEDWKPINTSEVAHQARYVRSPFQLTYIRDLSASHNVDAVRVTDILGDPMIKECWQFNYLFDVDWLMGQFDSDVREIVQVRIIHGSWKREAPNKIGIDEACQRYKNVKAITSHLPDPFGTHHSKMMVLLRHDDMAQVVIHTANMIPQDWTNLSQAVWMSPLLPLSIGTSEEEPSNPRHGSGQRFKGDFLAYLKAYRDQYGNLKLKDLVNQIRLYDFSKIRGSLIASVPSKIHLQSTGPDEPLWGWPALRRILRDVPSTQPESQAQGTHTGPGSEKHSSSPHIVIQVSSIATLGKDEKYLKDTIFSALSSSSTTTTSTAQPLNHPSSTKTTKLSKPPRPTFSIIFPTAATIRNSLDGYASGSSIHMKIQSAAQRRQLQTLRPYLCHWSPPPSGDTPPRQALRNRAAPHIKTYIRFADSTKMDRIDWAMVTSANLSTQAWGSAVSNTGEVRVQSYEIGVVVWPELMREDNDDNDNAGKEQVCMVPTFGKDTPDEESAAGINVRGADADDGERSVSTWLGCRMPYDLPLSRYSNGDVPWCATMNHMTPDWMGRVWDGGDEER